MRKRKLWLFSLSVVLLFVLSACGGATEESQPPADNNGDQEEPTNQEQNQETITLKVADQFPETNVIASEGTMYFMQRAEELSNGAITFDYFPGEQLGKANQMLDVVKNKTADISIVASAYVSDKMPLNGVAELPGSFETTTQGAEAIWEISRGILLEPSFLDNGVRPLFVTTLHPYPVFTANKKIEEVADWQGLKIRTSGGAQDLTVATLGGTPVSIPSPDLYSALERKTVDGGILGFSSWKPYQIDTIAKYSTTNIHLGTALVNMIINDEVFQGLSPELQEALVQAGHETVQHFSQLMDEQYVQLRDEFAEKGIDMYELTDEQLASWKETLAPVTDDWVESMNGKGLPGQEVLDAYNEAIANGITWE